MSSGDGRDANTAPWPRTPSSPPSLDTWPQTDAGIPGHPIPVYTLDAQPAVSIAFMRLPDVNADGSRFAAYGSQILLKLWTSVIFQISTVDGSSTYTLSDLTQTLTGLMTAFQPDRIGTQDFVGSFGDGDHSDHHATAYITRAAGEQYSTPHELLSYGDYTISSQPANLTATHAEEADGDRCEQSDLRADGDRCQQSDLGPALLRLAAGDPPALQVNVRLRCLRTWRRRC